MVTHISQLYENSEKESEDFDSLEIRSPDNGGTSRFVSVYEKARIIAARARQIEAGDKILVPKGSHEKELDIAAAEYNAGVLDSLFYIVRISASSGTSYRVLLGSLRK